MIPIENTSMAQCAVTEERILEHMIQRAIAGEPLPAAYRIGDRDFMCVVRRVRPTIVRENGVTYVDIGFGSTIARVIAGGLTMPEHMIELVERDLAPMAPAVVEEFRCRAPGMQPCECCEAIAADRA